MYGDVFYSICSENENDLIFLSMNFYAVNKPADTLLFVRILQARGLIFVI